MKKLFLSLACSLCISGLVLAQKTLVHPSPYSKVEGESSWSVLFGYSTYSRYRQVLYQQVHDRLAPFSMVIKGISFRRDGANLYFWPSWSATLELVLSTAPSGISSTTLSKVFASNMGKDAKTVIAKKKVSFPPSVPGPKFPRPFVFRLPFDPGRYFPFQGNKNLTWFMKVYDNDLATTVETYIQLDRAYMVSPRYNPPGLSVPIGKGGFAPNQYRSMECNFYTYFDRNSTPNVFRVNPSLNNGPRGGKALVLFSTVRMPFGIPLGAGGGKFWLHLGAICYQSRLVDLDYYGNWGKGIGLKNKSFITIPDIPGVHGLHVFGQVVTIDMNNFLIYLPNACEVQMPWCPRGYTGPNVGFTYYRGSTSSTFGYGPYRTQGIIVEFLY